jgi:PST family polysaccharide transporter
VNILLNLALIPHFGGVGAAVSTVVSYAVAAVLCCFAYQKTRRLGFMQLHAITHPLSAFRIPRAPDDDL